MNLSSISSVRLVTKIQASVRGHQLRNKQLLEAAKIGDIERTKNLIKHGADVNASSKIRSCREGIYGRRGTALYWAVRHNSEDIVKLLLKAGAKTDVIYSLGDTLLHCAANDGNLNIVELLLDFGVEVNFTNEYGETALHGAVLKGHVDIVKLLLKAGANVNVTNIYGKTALRWAAYDGNLKIVKALVIAGADVNATENNGKTALQLAKICDCYDDVKKAIEEGKTQLIKLVKEMPTKIEETLNSLDKLPNLPSEIIKTIVDGYFNPEQIKQAEKYIEEREAAAATKIQAMARGNLVR